MRRAPILLLLLSPACMTSHPDLAEPASMGPTTFGGYSQTAGQSVRVRAFNYATQQWVTVATAVASTWPDIPAQVWGDNPNLYAWSVTTPIATAADPMGRCFLNASCAPREGTPGTSTARLMFEEGSASSPYRHVVFDERWSSCIGQRMATGQSFNAAAYDCRAPSYPELRLRVTEAWTALPAGAPAGAIGGVLRQEDNATVVASDGSALRSSSRGSAGTWSPWESVASSPPATFPLTTEPVIASTWAGRFLSAIGLDGQLYRSLYLSGGWRPLRPIAGISGAGGRLSAMQTVNTFQSEDMWMAYAVAGGNVQVSVVDPLGTVRRTESFPGTEVVLTYAWDNPISGAAAAMLAAVRDAGGLTFRRIPGNAPPQLLGSYDPGPFAELSEMLTTNGRAHLLLVQPTAGGGGQVVALSFVIGQPLAVTSRVLGSLPAGAPLARPALSLVEGTLIAAWPHPTAGLVTARLAPGGGGGSWVSDALSSFVPLAGAPRLFESGAELEVVARGADGRLRTARPARAMLRRQVERELDVFTTTCPAAVARRTTSPTRCGSATWRRCTGPRSASWDATCGGSRTASPAASSMSWASGAARRAASSRRRWAGRASWPRPT